MFKKLIMIGLCTALCGCVSTQTMFPTIDEKELYEETKRQQQMHDQAKLKKQEKQMQSFLDQQERLVKVAKKILKGGVKICNDLGLGKNGCLYSFELEKSGAVNAYTDGKKIAITTAMMSFAKTDEELAVVLGHEYAHDIMGHINAKKTNMSVGHILGTFLDTVASSQGISTGSALGKLGAQAGAHSYSQEFEKEADYVGLYITQASGYNIDEAPNFWRRMSLRDGKAIKNAFTHPTNPERYIGLGKTIREIKRKQTSGEKLLPNLQVKK